MDTHESEGIYDLHIRNRKRRMGSDKPEVKGTILTPNTISTVGCWNVLTLLSAIAPKLLIQELQHLKLYIVGILDALGGGE